MTASAVAAATAGFAILLFSIAALADAAARRGKLGWLRSPLVYTLSLSVYCTAWTFYGAVGYATRSGLEFLTIYLGPTLVMIGWWWILRKLVIIGRAQRITSIADLVSSRYGKSTPLGFLVTLVAVLGTAPYVALQLQSISASFAAVGGTEGSLWSIGLWVALGLALFSILFGTRTLDTNARQHGVVAAIAFEAVLKLVALVAVGVFVVWGLAGGPAETLARIDASPISDIPIAPGRWTGILILSAAAFLCLPRMFHVMVVESPGTGALRTASWAFPLYLLLMSLFVVPIAVVGLERLPQTNPDLFVLALPLSEGQGGLALLAFLGGLSSATSMVIVASIALATMVSNNVVAPIWLASSRQGATLSGDVRRILLRARRAAILGLMALAFAYWTLTDQAALASIGLISFAGAAQILPAMLGGIVWRGATRWGAAAGLVIGLIVWGWTLLLPSFGHAVIGPAVLADGPLGLSWLRPTALFGTGALDPLVHATLWSLALNTAAFCAVSLLTFPTPLERFQGAQFVGALGAAPETAEGGPGAETEKLLMMTQRILGADEAQALFAREAARQGVAGWLPDATPGFLRRLERELGASVGASMAHAMTLQVSGAAALSTADLMAAAGETRDVMEQSVQLRAKSEELERTARQLRDANDALTRLSHQKDAFLGQVSHELRTPMTSIRAFADILADPTLPEADRLRMSRVIAEEGDRLTRLLDDLLDLSVMESGTVRLDPAATSTDAVIDRALRATSAMSGDLSIEREGPDLPLVTDEGRLAQVIINLVANAAKYAGSGAEVVIRTREIGDAVAIDVVDDGPGISSGGRAMIFEKFARLSDAKAAGGAGLGLAICREIMTVLGGTIEYLPGQGGAAFRIALPCRAGELRAAE